MTARVLDVRGRPCPEPVVETRRALAEPGLDSLAVLVDDQDSADNVVRLATTLGWKTQIVQQADGCFEVQVGTRTASASAKTQGDAKPAATGLSPAVPSAKVVVLIPSDRLGEGNEELGALLLRSFLKTLKDLPQLPSAAVFVNGGVHLTTEGSGLLADLRALEAAGVQILSCGLCLDYFHKKEQLRVGRVTNMFEIVSLLTAADRLLRV